MIDGAESALYTPGEDDVGLFCMRWRPTRTTSTTDQDEKTVPWRDGGVSCRISDPANTAPKFPDQDLNTPGDQSDTAMRSVAENAERARRLASR